MTFFALEESRYAGTPILTYLFQYGGGAAEYFAYTDAERGFDFEGVTYAAVPIQHDAVSVSGGRAERRDLKIRLSAKDEFLNLFIVYPPDQSVSVLIRGGHFDDADSEFVAVFNGKVINVKSTADGWAEILCRPLWTASQQGGLRRHYQIGCPHVLYGDQCGATPLSVAAAVTAIPSLNQVTLNTGWEGVYGPGKFRGGWLQWTSGANTIRRTVLRLSDDTLVLSGPVTGLSSGAAVDVFLGCNRQMNDCQDIHGNIQNYGGQPWIPTKNPVNTNPFHGG